jgi:2-methylcitrate dehydratase PrpD
VWRITEVAHKPFPSGRATHGIIDAILELKSAHGINAADVRSVDAQVPQLTHQLVGRPIHKNMDANYARLNARYAAAIALQRGSVHLDDFVETALQDKATITLAEKVNIVVDDNPDPNALSPVTLKITASTGATYSKTIDTVLGHPSKPLDRKTHLTKFETNCKYATMPPPAVNQKHLIRMVDQLEDLTDVRQILDLIAGA